MLIKKEGKWLALIILTLVLIAAYSEAAEQQQQIVIEIEGMTCDL
jgi:hypothetical protein